MEIGLSTRSFVSQRLGSHMLDTLDRAGIRQIEIFAARQHFDYRDSNHVGDVAQWFSDHGVALHSLHAPAYAGTDAGRAGNKAISPSYTERRLRIESMDEIKRVIEVAERLPFRFLVLHLGLPDDEYSPHKADAAFTSLEHLHLFALERGVGIALENSSAAISTPDRLAEFIQYTRLNVKVCFDTGHAHLTGGVLPAFERLKPLISTAHLHDNKQDADSHLMPFEGSICWADLMKELRGLSGAFTPVLELQDAAANRDINKVQEAMRKLEQA